jgi:hypothetical protein
MPLTRERLEELRRGTGSCAGTAEMNELLDAALAWELYAEARRLLLEPCETCAALLDTLENLLDSMPSPARSARLPENDDDGSTVVWPKWYIDGLRELRKHRPGRIAGRCALCGSARTLLVEERPWAAPEKVPCPNCTGGKKE